MITQSFKNGETEIRVENAESLEDAKINNFQDGVFSRFFINDKPVVNYMAMIRHIIDESRKTGNRFIPPSPATIEAMRNDMANKQNQEMKSQLEKIRTQYKQMGAPEHILKDLEDSINKINLSGMRVVE